MSKTRKGFGTVTDFNEGLGDSEFIHNLREVTGEPNIAFLRLDNDEIYAIKKEGNRFEDWSNFLREWQRFNRPVYVEADDDSSIVTMLLPSLPRRIEDIAAEPTDGLLPVVVFMSPSVHHLNVGHPNFDEMRGLLEQAVNTGQEVLVTADPDTLEILHVKGPEDGPGGGGGSFFLRSVVTESEAKFLFRDLTERFAFRSTTTEAQALAEFQNLAGQKHIPFDYPLDCCTARAHEMCRILRERNVIARKIWNYGSGWTKKPKVGTLHVETPNAPSGMVEWLYHVAPLLAVKKPSGAMLDMVFDPSIFNAPVLVTDWRARQQDEFSLLATTDDQVFYKDYFDFNDEKVVLDPEFIQTRTLLTGHLASRGSRR
jgi:hypothetical protein